MTTNEREVREALARFDEGMQEADARFRKIQSRNIEDNAWREETLLEGLSLIFDTTPLARQLNRIESLLTEVHKKLSDADIFRPVDEAARRQLLSSAGFASPREDEARPQCVDTYPRKLEPTHPIDRWRKMMENPPTGIGGEVTHLTMENLYQASRAKPNILFKQWPEMMHVLQTTELTRKEIYQLTGVSPGTLGRHESVLKPCYGTGKGARTRLYKGIDVHRWMRSQLFKDVIRRKKGPRS